MIKFDSGEFSTNPGSPIRTVYSAKVEKDGSVILSPAGVENTDDLIQAAKASTDIETIISYYNQTGDESVLRKYAPKYGDFTQLPKSLAEFLQLRIDSQNFFDALPVDVKKQFDNDSNKFFAQAGEKDWYEKLSPVLPSESSDILVEPIVKESESVDA